MIEIQLSCLKLLVHLLQTWMAALADVLGCGVIITWPVWLILHNCFPVFSSHKVAG